MLRGTEMQFSLPETKQNYAVLEIIEFSHLDKSRYLANISETPSDM